MSRWKRCGERAFSHWATLWGPGVVAETLTAITMFFVAIILLADAMLVMPFSIYNAIREK
jgi:hypothetical protein